MSFLPATDPLSIRQNVYWLFVSFVSIHIDIVFTKYIDTRIIIDQNYEFWNYLLVIDTSLVRKDKINPMISVMYITRKLFLF